MAGQNPTVIAPHTLTVTSGLQGSYSVTLTTQPDQTVRIVSTGVVGKSTRVVTAVIQPGTGTAGSGSTGGGTGSPAAPPGVPPQVFQQAVYANGSLQFDNNNALICGDLYVVGSVDLGNNSRVIGSPAGGCSTVVGTGKVIATGAVIAGNNTVIEGGWCDATHYGAGRPCAAAPTAAPLTSPDFGALSSQATARFSTSQSLSGAKSYNNDLVYINGNLTLNGLAVQGTVTFAVTGSVNIWNNLTCSGSCSVAIVSSGAIQTSNNLEVWSTLVTGSTLNLGNQVIIHGNIQASSMTTGNGPIFYPAPGGTAGGTGTAPALKGWNS
jgi:hypothetical protein